MILVFFGICLFLFIGAVVELAFSYARTIDIAKSDSDNLSQVFQTQIESTFKQVDLVLLDTAKTLGSKNRIEDWKDEELSSLLHERTTYLPEINNFSIIGKDGYDRSSRLVTNRLQLSDRDYFYKQITSDKDELIFSRPIVSRVTGRLVMVLSRKIQNKQNEFQGVVVAAIPLIFFSEFYSKLNLRPNSAINITSSDNLLFSRYPWAEKFIGMPIYNHDTIKELFSNNKESYFTEKTSRVDGVSRFISSRKVGDYNFFVSVALSKFEYLKGWLLKSLIYFLCLSTLSILAINFLLKSLNTLSDLEDQRKLAVQNAKLTSLGEMAGGIAHEINNPLAIVSGRCNLLLKMLESDDYDKDDLKKSLEKINQTTDRIVKIIKNLKSFSRNNEKDPFIPVAVSEIIESTTEICKDRFRHSSVLLKVDVIPDLRITCRETQLVQVLLNLLGNAFDAVEKIDEAWVKLSVEISSDNKVLLKVTDAGNGISETIAANIMQPFFTTKAVGKGTGLGLSISKAIIEEHKGAIYLDRNSFNTCFVVEMPLA